MFFLYSYADAGLCAALLENMISALEDLTGCERLTLRADNQGGVVIEELGKRMREPNARASGEERRKALMIATIGFDLEPLQYKH